MSLARLVANKRRNLDMSLADVSRIAGVSRQYVNDIEHGKVTNPSALVVIGLAKALKLKRDDLMEAIKVGARDGTV